MCSCFTPEVELHNVIKYFKSDSLDAVRTLLMLKLLRKVQTVFALLVCEWMRPPRCSGTWTSGARVAGPEKMRRFSHHRRFFGTFLHVSDRFLYPNTPTDVQTGWCYGPPLPVSEAPELHTLREGLGGPLHPPGGAVLQWLVGNRGEHDNTVIGASF